MDTRDSRPRFPAGALLLAAACAMALPASAGDAAKQILALSGVKGGLVVHVGCGDGTLTAALRASDSFAVHGLDADPARVAKARAHIRSLGLYGPVAADRWTSAPRLPYADNLASLVVVSSGAKVARDELLRVLAPGGVACSERDGAWTKTVKPRPDSIDEWTHTLYDASNNAVARDTVVAPPQRVQWVGAPRNARHHERLASITVAVSAGGRLFYVVDEAPAGSILLRPDWKLVARDAFNGVVLWKRPIADWEPHLRGFRSGPPELARRLVAAGGRVFATLGLRAPVSVLDAATGRTVATLEGSEGTEEILHHDGTLFLAIAGTPKPGNPAAAQKTLAAADAAKGTVLWRKQAACRAMSLTAGGGSVFCLADDALVGLDAKTGRELWRTPRTVARKRPGWSAPTVVVSGDVVLCADRQPPPATTLDESTGKKTAGWLADGGYPGDLVAHDAATGKELWRSRVAETYHAAIDVFVIDGVVWSGLSRSRTGPDFTTGRDLHTGKIVHRIAPHKAYQTTMPHHRCYRNRATSRFILGGRTGVEFIDVASGNARRHHWVRGTCQFGILPCNGLLYAPPHSCACYIEAKLAGFYALAGEGRGPALSEAEGSRGEGRGEEADLLEPGPAFDQPLDTRPPSPGPSSAWPTLRHDAARTGCTPTAVPAPLHVRWKAPVGGRLTSPVAAGGVALVASVDAHTVHALDARTGKPLWHFTAGARIDSPPSIASGLAVFGSADGWVYCVRVADGALAWRFRAAPSERRITAFGQVESAWPVHGSVLVRDGTVTCAAGRTSYLDGGIRLVRLDLRTGRKLAEQTLASRDPKTGEQPAEPMMFEMPGALPDVLSADGDLLFMRRLAFDPQTLAPRTSKPHLYSPAGFLNGDWWHRTYWIYGEHFYSGYIGWYFAGHENLAGRLLLVHDPMIYGFSYKPSFYRGATGRQYHLFAADRTAQPATPPPDYRRANRDYPHSGRGTFRVKFAWQKDVPLLARAMVLAGDTLWLAGPPDQALRSALAFEGKRGGILCAVAAKDGTTLAQHKLGALPVHDGMAAARGCLYLSLTNGELACLGAPEPGKDQPPLPPLGAPDATPPGTPREPGLAGHWSLDEGAGAVAADSSGLANNAEIYGRWVTGPFGTAIATRGVPGAVTIWDGAHLHFGADSFSIAFWVKVDAYDCRLLGKEDFPREWWVVNVLPDGRTELVLGTGREAGKSVRPTSKTPLSKETWTHVAFVVDRKAAQVTSYINGAADKVTKIPAPLTGGLSVAGKDLRIPSLHKPFRGFFDELKLYRRTLTPAEVKADFDREKPRRKTATATPAR